MTASEFEFLLDDRMQKIRQIITQYMEDNFYISFSGGRDSTVLRDLIDRSVPGNNIPSVHINTGHYKRIEILLYRITNNSTEKVFYCRC